MGGRGGVGGRGSDATRRAAVGRHSPVRCGRQRRFHGVHGVHRALRWALRDGVTVTGAAWGGWGGGGQEVGAGRAAGRHPLPPPPPPTVRGGAELPWAHPAPPAAPGAGTWRPARHGTAGTRLPRCQPGGGPGATPTLRDRGGERHPPPSPSHSVTPTGVDPTGDGTPQRHLLGSPLGTRQLPPPPPTPPFLPSVTAGRGNPRGLPPPPGAAHPHRGYFPPSERSATLSVPPRPRAGVAGRGRLRAPRCQRYRGGGGERTPPHPSPQSDAPGGALSPANAAPGSGGRGAIFSRSAAPRPLRAFLPPPPLRPPSPPTKMRPRAPPGPGPALTVPSGPRWPWRRRARAAARKLRGIFSPRATPAP